MLLDAATAKSLFAIIMISTQGADVLNSQLPLQVEDRGESWLVKGTPFTTPYANYSMSHIFFRKDNGEVIGIMSHGRVKTTAKDKAHWLTIMSPDQYESVFGPPTHFEPNGIHGIYLAVSGGLINTPADAADYAAVLLKLRSPTANIRATELKATEIAGVWHVQRQGAPDDKDILSFERKSGKVLSGDL